MKRTWTEELPVPWDWHPTRQQVKSALATYRIAAQRGDGCHPATLKYWAFVHREAKLFGFTRNTQAMVAELVVLMTMMAQR